MIAIGSARKIFAHQGVDQISLVSVHVAARDSMYNTLIEGSVVIPKPYIHRTRDRP